MTPTLLLDTDALLWWLAEPEKLSSLAYAAINDPAATVFVSAAPAGSSPPRGAWANCLAPLAVELHHGVHAVELTSRKNPPTQMLERSASQAIILK